MTQPEPITWTVHLASRRPGRAVMALVLIFFALCAVAAVGKSWLLTIIAAFLLLGSIAEFLLPVTYTLDAKGAHARQFANHRLLPWRDVRRVYLSRNGIKLSPLVVRSWAESYRGVLLRTSDRDATLKVVSGWLKNAGVTPEIIEES